MALAPRYRRRRTFGARGPGRPHRRLVSHNVQDRYTWQDYLAPQPPMEWPPQADDQLNEIANDPKGGYPLSPTLSINPENPTLSINPENWYSVK